MATTAAILDILVRADTDKATASLRGVNSSLDKTARTARETGRTIDKSMSQSGSSYSRASTNARRASAEHDRLNKSSHRVGGALKAAGGAALGAAAAYVGIAQAVDAVSTTEDLAKATISLNQNLGIGVKVASEYAAVASSRGVDSNKLGMAFKTLSKQIVAANDGSTTSVDLFKKLGFSQKEIKKGADDVGFAVKGVADGLQKMGPGAERAAAAGTLFGRGWQPLIPILRDGKKGLQEQLDIADKYGATFGGKSVKGIQDLIASQRELKIAQMGLQIQFTEKIAPALIDVGLAVAKFVHQMETGKGAGGQFAAIMRGVGKVLVVLYQIVKRAVIIIIGIVNVIKDVVNWFHKLPAPVRLVGKVIFLLISGPFVLMVATIKNVIQHFGALRDAFNWVVRAAKNLGSGIANGVKAGLNAVIGFVNDIIGILNKIPFVEIGTVGKVGGGGNQVNLGTGPSSGNKSAGGKHHSGGQGRQKGGIMVPGQGSGDKVPAMLEPGEVVWNKKAVAALGGAQRANAVNKAIPRFSLGGDVLKGAAAPLGPVISTPKNVVSGAKAIGGLVGKAPSFFIDKLPKANVPSWLGGLGEGLKKGAIAFIKDKAGSVFGGGDSLVQIGFALQKAGFSVGEHPAFGGVTPGAHVDGSLHYQGRAIDVNRDGGPKSEPSYLRPLYGGLSKIHPTELFYQNRGIPGPVPNHFDHLHLGIQRGGIVQALRKGGTAARRTARRISVTRPPGWEFWSKKHQMHWLKGQTRHPGLPVQDPGHTPTLVRPNLSRLRGGIVQHLAKGGKLDALVGGSTNWDLTERSTLAHIVGMAQPGLMGAISMVEAPNNLGGSKANGPPDGRGLWQIEWPVHSGELGHLGDPYNPYANALMAKSILGSQGLGAWVVYNNHAYGAKGTPDKNLAVKMKANIAGKAVGASVGVKSPKLTKADKRKARHDKLTKAIEAAKKNAAVLDVDPRTNARISRLQSEIAQLEEYAGYASDLGADDAMGSYRGQSEAQLLQQELEKLLNLRDVLAAAYRVMQATHDALAKQVAQMKKHLGQLTKIPHRKRTKAQKALIQSLRPSIAGASTSLTGLAGKIGTDSIDGDGILGLLATIQGSGGPFGIRQGNEQFGGQILQTQLALRDLGQKGGIGADSSEALSIQKTLSDDWQKRYLVSQAQYPILQNFGGSFATGGVVPGPIGAPMIIQAHGGETVTPVGAAPVVEIVIANGMEWLRPFIRAEVKKQGKRDTRNVGRTPGSAGSLRG